MLVVDEGPHSSSLPLEAQGPGLAILHNMDEQFTEVSRCFLIWIKISFASTALFSMISLNLDLASYKPGPLARP